MTELRERWNGFIATMKDKGPAHEFKYDLGDLVVWKGITCEVAGCSWNGEKETYQLVRAEPPDEYIDAAEIERA